MSRCTVLVMGLDMLLFATEHVYSECRSALDKLLTVSTFLTVELDNSIKSESTIVPFLFQTTLGFGFPATQLVSESLIILVNYFRMYMTFVMSSYAFRTRTLMSQVFFIF